MYLQIIFKHAVEIHILVFRDIRGVCQKSIIQNSAKCEVRFVIQFLNAMGQNATEIHRERSGNGAEWEGRSNVHDNGPSIQTDDLARLHTSARSVETIEIFRWELFNYPPYSPDLTPSDFFIFLHLKGGLHRSISTTALDTSSGYVLVY